MQQPLRVAAVVVGLIIIVVAAYVLNVGSGLRARAQTSGTIAGTGVRQPVQILRDARGIPHIRARDRYDLFFAQGFAEASDRGFQLDLLRRFVYGQLSEVLGQPALSSDEESRTVPVRNLVAQQWQGLDASSKLILQAFSDGVNAAFARESTPVEFRILMYKPQAWRPEDSLAVGFATVLDLADTWNDIAGRIHKDDPLSDPCYEAPVTEGLAKIADPKQCTSQAALFRSLFDRRPPVGSNEWAAGAAHTTTRRALLANDPHLRLGIPGVWYLVDLQAPDFHAAGAVLAGVPGVILGHNDAIAWGATNGTVTALSVFDPPEHLDARYWKTESFGVRFGIRVTKRYYRAPREFGATIHVGNKDRFVLVRWSAYSQPVSPLSAFSRLDEAHSIDDGIKALHAYPGPTQNFVLADRSGRVAYQLAGEVPDDPLWSRAIHPAVDLAKTYAPIPFEVLPHVAPSRNAIVWSANNKMYGPRYRYRLTAEFRPPYRAHRIAELLRARPQYDVSYFASMQMDTLSIAEREFAEYFKPLRSWDGRFTPDSSQATAAFRAREQLTRRYGEFATGMIAARVKPGIIATINLPPSPAPWGVAGAVTVRHPLAALGMSFLNGTTFAGDGDAYTVHVQNNGFSQSFRAVWDVGNWDAGGVTIPQGNSGRPGSGHYTDEAADWIAGRLLPLAYSRTAVDRAAVERLTLTR